MALALSKRVKNALVQLAEAEKTAYDAEVAFQAFAKSVTTEVSAWPKTPDGKLIGYNVTAAQLIDALALARDRRLAAEAHPVGAALLLEVLKNGNR